MPRINVLPKEISELIAAGEVVERPASVVKEMIENSLDAGSNRITVEIERGGITYIRITDDGCGIAKGDVKTAFLRHATSKIKSQSDLDSIKTLGFRGEALAATAAVSKVEMLTHAADEEYGTHYVIEGGSEALFEESGCPAGTTIIVRDIFYNTPARMKFLKKDATEGAAVAAIVSRAAISNPKVSFKFIRDGKQVFFTGGNGDLKSAIYSVLGREYTQNLIEVKSDNAGIKVYGFCSAPFACRASRAGQYTYLNRRLVISKTVMAAAEQAYKNSIMVGKFPAFVLFVDMPYEAVDVNVHPAKTEVRFADEKAVFSAVYAAVKGALSSSDARPQISLGNKKGNEFFANMDTNRFKQTAVSIDSLPQENTVTGNTSRPSDSNIPFFLRKEFVKGIKENEQKHGGEKPAFSGAYFDRRGYETGTDEIEPAVEAVKTEKQPFSETNVITDGVIFLGEAFRTYVIVQKGDSVFILDKHACHERIIFNRLKSETEIESQPLLMPVSVHLSERQYSAVTDNCETLLKAGIEVEDFGNETVMVRAVPAALVRDDAADVVIEAADKLISGSSGELSLIDDILHTVACKAATKAGYISSNEELITLAERVLSNNDVLYCPHGRPVAIELKKSELERRFGRIQ